ncbi:uncharacterized protein PAC_02702 [Phialocephala subalpina]|uniref:DUF6604 domain-containing protein n=1 Tax=Phialocephala subalpina TaxID=576137 RepID=A0A1L7WJ65_9HELO|nr:uncharacterized protein PAC_02702 [Phialocephala subalpina]
MASHSLPAFHFDTYKRSKFDQSRFTSWLGDAARKCGYFGRGRESSTKPPHESNKKGGKKTIETPSTTFLDLQDLLLLAQAVADSGSQIPLIGDEQHKASNGSHRHTINILEQVLEILLPRSAAEAEQKSKASPVIVDNMGHKVSIELANSFEGLDVEDPPSGLEDFVDEHKAVKKKPTSSEYTYELKDDPADFSTEIFYFFHDLNKIRTYLKQLWKDYQDGKVELPTASIATDTAIEMVQRNEREFLKSMERYARKETIKGYETTAVLLWYIVCESHGLQGNEFTDPEVCDVAEDLYMPIFSHLKRYLVKLRPYQLTVLPAKGIKDIKPIRARRSLTHRERITEDETSYTNSGIVSISLVFAAQSLLDIFHIARSTSSRALAEVAGRFLAQCWGGVNTCMHLYNAARKSDLCKAPWADMEFLLDTHGEEFIFFGGAPKKPIEFFKKFFLSFGRSVENFARNSRRGKDQPAIRAEGKPKKRSQESNGRSFTLGDVEMVLAKSAAAADESPQPLPTSENYVIKYLGHLSKTQKRNHNPSRLSPLQFLDALCIAISAETTIINFDYTAMHIRCMTLLRRLHDDTREPLIEKYGWQVRGGHLLDNFETDDYVSHFPIWIFKNHAEIGKFAEEKLKWKDERGLVGSMLFLKATRDIEEFVAIEGTAELVKVSDWRLQVRLVQNKHLEAWAQGRLQECRRLMEVTALWNEVLEKRRLENKIQYSSEPDELAMEKRELQRQLLGRGWTAREIKDWLGDFRTGLFGDLVGLLQKSKELSFADFPIARN